MKKVLLFILLLCTYMATISQNPILRKNVYHGVTGSGMQQVAKPSNDLLFDVEVAADTYPGLFRTDGSNVTKVNSFTTITIDNWGVVGSATPNGWNGPDIPLTYDAISNTWSAVVSLSNGAIKFRNNNDWAVNYGDNGADGSLDAGGSDIVVTAGNYLITLNFTTLNYSLKTPFISIPDSNFEQALIDLGFDKDGVINASISTSDAEAITQLDVTGKNIGSLQGIEAFINLSRLFCQNNQIQVLNISKNTALTVLECGDNQLTTLNVSKNLLLRVLGFGFNNISVIDVSQNLNLEVFWCNNNQIVSQNLDLNPALTVVGLSNNPLTFVSLKNGNNIKIVYFEAYNTPKLGCINADPVVPVSMINSGKTFSDNCAKAYYVNDDLSTGDIFTSAIGNNTNAGTKASPFATLTYALSQSAEGDTIYVDAGTYVEQVTINNGVTVIGAGQNLTLILKPAATVAPPGSFFEQGVIQTSQSITGDVHISNLSVTGDLGGVNSPAVTPIILQTGGSVKNCILQNGNQGVFVRIDPTINLATKTFVVDNNTITAEYIAVNFAGTRLTATLTNNNIAAFNPGFSSAVFAVDFGTLAGLTVTGNTFSSYVSDGMLLNTNNGTISQNSFLGTGQKAINKIGGSTINATCNWYGSPLAATVVSKITPGVNFSPWLINGTDNSTAVGFQTSATCPVANSFYVNDNSQAGDVFTTAVGNNANTGTSIAPYATLDYALAQVPAGATIYVDAGAYTIPAINITKSVTILGPNHTISPNNASNKAIYNTERNTEARLTGGALNIGADWIFMNGLRFTPTTTAITMTGDYSHIKFNNNYFDVVSAFPTVLLQGNTSSPSIVAFDFMVTDNRFERMDNGTGITLLIGNVRSMWVDNNTFIESGPSFNRSVGLRTLNPFSVDGLAFTNNYLKKLNQAVNVFTLQNSTISANKFDSTSQGIIYSPSNLVSNNVSINNNQFTNLRQGRAVLVRGGSNAGINNLNVSNNSINLEVNGTGGIVGLIQLEFTAANTFGAANVIGNKINISGDYSQTNIGSTCGIILTGKHANTTISFNELNFTAINAGLPLVLTALPPVPAGIFINTDGTSGNGLIPASAVINIANNKINGFKQSVAIYDPIAGLTPQIGYGYLTSGSTININNNSFTGDSLSIDNGTTSQSVSATCNWYGSAVENDVKLKVTGTTVQSIPWLTNGTDNDVATGFQPLPNNCNGYSGKLYVNDNTQTGDVFTTSIGNNNNPGTATAPFGSLDYAISLAKNGDTIYVDAGTYSAVDFTINKSVSILGTNYLLSPNDAGNPSNINSIRNTEAVIENITWTIGANDINLEGLTFNPNNKQAIIMNNTNFGNIKLSKNRFRINSSLIQVSITGNGSTATSPAGIVNGGLTVADNRFEKLDAGGGTSLAINRFKGIGITNNVFVVAGETFRTQIALSFGSSGVVDGLYCANNTFDNSSSAFSGARIGNAFIIGNTINNANNAFIATNSIPESSDIFFVNNIINGSAGILPFIQYNRTNGAAAGAVSNFTIENNIITANAVAGTTTILGSMNLIFQNSVLNPRLTVGGNVINYGGDLSTVPAHFIRPIMLRGNLVNAVIEKNEINLTGINQQQRTAGVDLPVSPAITLHADNGTASFLQSGSVINIRNNKINGFKHSLAVYDALNGRDTYIGYGNIYAGVTVNVNNNSFTGDSISINNGSIAAATVINATCNWYGTAAAQTILTKVSSNSAQVFPYLTNGTDTDAATGFQPTANTCDGSIPLITLNSFTNATCFGAANGSVNITASLGKAPFVFTWTKVGDANFISNDEDPTNFAAGTYRLAVTDANGTTIYKTSIESAEPGILEVIIAEPSAVTAAISNTSTACSNIATVTAGGGTPGYTYLWSNGSTYATISGVPVGTYTVTVTDANGCTATETITLTVAEAFNPSASVTNVTCFGANDGVITVTNINGTAPFMFSKDGGINFENGSLPFSFTNLAPGNYTIAVKDANGCVGFVERTVVQPTPLVATISNVQSTCFGTNTGAITMSVSGGVTAYGYSWTKIGGGFSSSQLNISGLAAGNYTLTVTDKNNCTYSIEVLVPANAEILVNESISNVTCRGAANGSIAVNASSGGNTNFSYLWNTGATTASIGNLAPGNYSVRVTDNTNSCFVNKSFIITQPALALSLTTAKTNATGCNSLGTITATGSGGTAPYTYYMNGVLMNNNSAAGLYAGDYNITVTDANGCTTSKIVTITDNGSDEFEGNNSKNQAKPISVGTTINARLALSNDAADWFTFIAPGSTSGLYSIKTMHPDLNVVYTVSVFASGKNTAALVPVSVITSGESHYQLTAGATYFVSITTTTLSYKCYSFAVSALEPIEGANRIQNNIATAPSVDILKAFTYPNPHNGNFTLSIESPEEGVATVELYTVNGQKLSERKANVVMGKGNTVKYSNMNHAILFYKVRIGKHTVTGKIISPN